MICAQGHDIRREDLYVYPRTGKTECRRCQRDRSRVRRATADRTELRAYWRERKQIARERSGRKDPETYWTPGRVRELVRLYCQEGLTIRRIAWIFDRREPAIRCKVARLQLKKTNSPARQRRA